MMYMSSTCGNDGSYTLVVTFELGTDPSMAQVLVQNRVSLATAQLPDEVQRQGLSILKTSPNILLVISLYSPDRSRDQLYLSNYVSIQIKDEIYRLPGVGNVNILGEQDYSMRVWLDPDKLAYNGLTTTDAVNALKEQNVQVAAGLIGQEPAPPGQAFQFNVNTLGRLMTEDQFGDIVVKVGQQGQDNTTRPAVRLKDVARLELGALNQNIRNTLDGGPAVGLATFALPGSNSLDVADRIEAKMKQLSERFPPGVAYLVKYDTTPFITQSIAEVFNTLRDAIILVAIVVLFFLQDWKAMILPMIDVPVALTGTFAVLYALGFSMNNLTLFGLVLAIGIVVDDAIVVLENIERWIAMGYEPREATIRAMDEITGPIVAITLVLCSVFLPSSLLPGISGEFFRQFALTIASAMIISAINAMTMTPARAVSVFKGGHHAKEALPWWGWGLLLGYGAYYAVREFAPGVLTPLDPLLARVPEAARGVVRALPFLVAGVVVGRFVGKPLNKTASVIFVAFNKLFDWLTKVYGRIVAGMLRVSLFVLIGYAGLLALTVRDLTTTPVGFIPLQDKGYLLCNIQLPDAASVQRTSAVLAQIDDIVLGPVTNPQTGERDRKQGVPGVAATVGIAGQSVLLQVNGSNLGTMFLTLDDFNVRKHDPKQNGFQIMFDVQAKVRKQIMDANVSVFPPPPVDGLGLAGGYKVIVENRGTLSPTELQQVTDGLIAEIKKQPGSGNAFTQFRADTPTIYLDIDRQKCKQLGVAVQDVFGTLQSYLGTTFVNLFNLFGRTWQVNVSADAPFRVDTNYVRNLQVKNDKGDMVLLGTVAEVRDDTGPAFVLRYNLYPSAAVTGNLPQTTSSGDGMRIVMGAADKALPKQAYPEWTELFYMQTKEGNAAIYAFAGAVLLVYLVLAAKYESWSLPLAIILVVPMCVLSSLVGIRAVGLSMDIFVQVGFIVLVGLAAKNAILIVEFADQQRKEGVPLREAVLKSVELRLRPIVMTSFAFVLGVFPLVVADGAGAEMRKTLGLTVFAGMIGVTVFGIFLTPVFAFVVGKLTKDPPKKDDKKDFTAEGAEGAERKTREREF
jgi:multidrug efflux pump